MFDQLVATIATSGNVALIIAVLAWLKEAQRTAKLESRFDNVLDKVTTALTAQATSNETAAGAIESLTRQVETLARRP